MIQQSKLSITKDIAKEQQESKNAMELQIVEKNQSQKEYENAQLLDAAKRAAFAGDYKEFNKALHEAIKKAIEDPNKNAYLIASIVKANPNDKVKKAIINQYKIAKNAKVANQKWTFVDVKLPEKTNTQEVERPSPKTVKVNIRNLPDPCISSENATSCTTTYGDMHGNAMKVMWSLIQSGAATLDEQSYKAMWSLYDEKWPALTISETEANELAFNELLKKVRFTSGANVRFLGDILCDRGKSDLLTLKVLEAAKDNGVALEIIHSNHDDMFRQAMDVDYDIKDFNYNEQFNSTVVGVYELIKQNNEYRQKIKNLYNKVYTPGVTNKLISYELSNNGQHIDIFMHAANSPDIIDRLINRLAKMTGKTAKKLTPIKHHGTKESAITMAAKIDYLNELYAELMNSDKWENLKAELGDEEKGPLHDLLWNHGSSLENYSKYKSYCAVHNGHGSEYLPSGEMKRSYDDRVGKLPFNQKYDEGTMQYLAVPMVAAYKEKKVKVAANTLISDDDVDVNALLDSWGETNNVDKQRAFLESLLSTQAVHPGFVGALESLNTLSSVVLNVDDSIKQSIENMKKVIGSSLPVPIIARVIAKMAIDIVKTIAPGAQQKLSDVNPSAVVVNHANELYKAAKGSKAEIVSLVLGVGKIMGAFCSWFVTKNYAKKLVAEQTVKHITTTQEWMTKKTQEPIEKNDKPSSQCPKM